LSNRGDFCIFFSAPLESGKAPEHSLPGAEKHLTETYPKFGQVDVDALQKEGKNFDMMYYPENRHGISGYNAQHFAKLTMEYFLQHLKPEAWEESLKTVW
jgi:hypothetical protein